MRQIAVLVVCLFAAQAQQPVVRAALQAPQAREASPSFAVRDDEGKAVALEKYRGKVLLLNFWATWCGGCKQEMPRFAELQRSLGKKMSVLGLSVDEKGWETVKPFLASTKVGYPIAIASDGMMQAFHVEALPATFLIDSKGRIAARYTGLVDPQNLEANVRSLLAGR